MKIEDEYNSIRTQESVVILSKPNCKLCTELMVYLISRNIDFYKLDVNEHESGVELVEYVKNKHEIKSFPICFKDGIYVGCKDELIYIMTDLKFNDINNI